MSLSTDTKISLKEYNKISKDNELEVEITKTWNLKTTHVPVIEGTLDMTKEKAS